LQWRPHLTFWYTVSTLPTTPLSHCLRQRYCHHTHSTVCPRCPSVQPHKGAEAAAASRPPLPRALQALFGQQSKPALDLIDPGGAGWGEVRMKAWPLDQPNGESGAFVGTVAAQEQAHVKALRQVGGTQRASKVPHS
jgi:hypothetical protein